MALGRGHVFAESSCPGKGTRTCLTAFRVRGAGRRVWRRSINGTVSALATGRNILFVGGQFSSVDGHPRHNLAALAVDKTGKVLGFKPNIQLPVTALAVCDTGIEFATDAFGPSSTGPYFVGAPAIDAVYWDGSFLPWQIDFPPNDVPLSASDTAALAGNFSVDELTPAPGGTVARGDFSWIGPADNPAAGSLVWLG
jgi:hypothetical protein